MASSTEAVFERDNLATWYAQRHFQADPGVQQIFYLPTNAPPREIRLLEVNDMISETMPLEALDFGVDVGSAEQHTLYVLDVTPPQWAAVQRGELALPDNWTLDGSREVGCKTNGS